MVEGEVHFANNNGVRIHYRIVGSGPALILLHGFPDYWAGWRRQLDALAPAFTIIAPDMRGFNLSDRPPGVECYTIARLAEDVLAVLDDAGLVAATVAGHDLGGMVAWWLASRHPTRVRRLAVLAAPHPIDFRKGRKTKPAMASDYLDRLVGAGNAAEWTPERLSFWIKLPREREALTEAMRRTDIEAVRSIYRVNLSEMPPFSRMADFRVLQPTLVIFGDKDPFVPASSFDGVGEHVDGPLEIHKIADGGHFIHYEREEVVNPLLSRWAATP
jgi:pimeloyl-ACP methyl ester carboxylesterase